MPPASRRWPAARRKTAQAFWRQGGAPAELAKNLAEDSRFRRRALEIGRLVLVVGAGDSRDVGRC
jgi:hypothetical protein